MSPVLTAINDTALQPLSDELITQDEAIDLAIIPVKEFMLRQVDVASMNLFLEFEK